MSMMAGFGAYAEESSSDIGEPNGGAEVTLWHYFEHEADALNKMVKQYNESQSDIYIVPTSFRNSRNVPIPLRQLTSRLTNPKFPKF